MENKEQKILSEIKSMMSTIRTQLELLDAKMAELQQCVDPEEFNNNPIELDIDDVVEAPVAVSPVDAVDDLPFDDVPEAEPQQVETPAAEQVSVLTDEPVGTPVVEQEETPVVEQEETPVIEQEEEIEESAAPEQPAPAVQEEEDDDDDLPGIFDQPVPVYVAAQASPKSKQSVADAMQAEKLAWRTDMPGSQVKDVRSAISLNDRIIFINYLFGEDPIAFQNTITKVNTMTTLDEVVEYVKAEYPTWDLTSDLVYRFMMAVRRRVK
jgi:hypothetical protein